MKNFFAITGLVVLMLLPWVSISGADNVIYGPESFQRNEGAPDVYPESFNAIPGGAFLVLFNGDDEQESRVSSGSIALNGTEVVSQSELNENVERVIRPVGLIGANSLTITLNGDPGGYITLIVIRDKKLLPELTAGRLHLAWTSIADPNESIQLRLKNGSPRYSRSYVVRFFNEDGTLAAVSARAQLAPHASLNASVQSFLPPGVTWQTGSLEIFFCGRGGGRVLGFGIQSNGSTQTQTAIPLQWGGIRHYFTAVKYKKNE